jgi:aminobenzoyl-glutamate transport protein
MPKLVSTTGIRKDIDAKVTDDEKRGLRYAGIALLIYVAFILALSLPKGSFFRNDTTGALIPSSPLISSVVAVMFFLFIVVAAAYGVGARTVKNINDVPKYMQSGLSGSLSFFVMAFPAALFIQFFNASKLATVLAVKGAGLLEAMNFTGIPLAVGFVILSIFLNLFMTSSSAKWMILAPIFVPMFALLNFSPALTQLAFRLGDSISNPIAPINFFLPMVLGLMNQYKRPEDPEFGLGTLISYTLPYSIGYFFVLIVMLVVWMLAGLPLGPGAGLYI